MLPLPRHVAVIMDGNGRWAKSRLMPRSMGHKAGLRNMLSLVEYAFERGVEYVTLYVLSAENFSRPQEELEGLFGLFRSYFSDNVKKMTEKGVKLRVIGDLSSLPQDIQSLILQAEEESRQGEKTLSLAIGYGGRQEILRAVNLAVERGKSLSEEEFASLLYTDGIPAPDLLIRTGKEKRLSNFLLWQCAYTELYFSDKMFPDFGTDDLDAAIEDYRRRDRRYGKLSETVVS